MEDKLKTLESLYKAVSDGLTKKDFITAFDAVTKVILSTGYELSKKIDARLAEASDRIQGYSNDIEQLKNEFRQAVQETKEANTTTFANVKRRISEAVDIVFIKNGIAEKMSEIEKHHKEMMQSHNAMISEKMAQMEAKMMAADEKMDSMEDGEDANEEAIITKIEQDLPKLGKPVRDSLELLNGDERLDMSAIKNLKEELAALKKEFSDKFSSIPRGGMAARSSNSPLFHDLSSSTDGVTKIFSVPKNIGGVVMSSDFPTVLMENNGFTVNAARNQITLTTVNAPSAGSQLVFIGKSMFN